MSCSFCQGDAMWLQRTTQRVVPYGPRTLLFCYRHLLRYYLALA